MIKGCYEHAGDQKRLVYRQRKAERKIGEVDRQRTPVHGTNCATILPGPHLPSWNPMIATLRSKAVSGMSNQHNGLLSGMRIDIVFIPQYPFELKMKKKPGSIPIENNAFNMSSSQISPQPDRSWFAPTLKTARFPDTGAFAQWMSAPDTSRHARNDDHIERNIFDASLRALNHRKPSDNTMPSLKMVDFSVELPEAKSVRLAADFTDWEESPLDMIRFDGGIWSLTVPLPPGIYAYRFLVDGEWYDDPRVARRDPNRPDSAKAFVKVK